MKPNHTQRGKEGEERDIHLFLIAKAIRNLIGVHTEDIPKQWHLNTIYAIAVLCSLHLLGAFVPNHGFPNSSKPLLLRKLHVEFPIVCYRIYDFSAVCSCLR